MADASCAIPSIALVSADFNLLCAFSAMVGHQYLPRCAALAMACTGSVGLQAHAGCNLCMGAILQYGAMCHVPWHGMPVQF